MKISLKLFSLLFICALAAFASNLENKHREFSRTKEKELRVILDVSFGSISIERSEEEIIASVDYSEEEDAKTKTIYIL